MIERVERAPAFAAAAPRAYWPCKHPFYRIPTPVSFIPNFSYAAILAVRGDRVRHAAVADASRTR